MKRFDVTALGEILIDFTLSGVSKNNMKLFEQNPGGAPANVLAAVAKLGGKTSFIGKVGKDMHGAFLIDTLKEHRIETKGVIEGDDCFTTLAFVSLSPSGERSFSFARKPGADTCLTAEEIDYSLISDSNIFHVGSLSLTDEPARNATIAALNYAKEKGITISYDPNYRAALWKSQDTAIEGMRSILGYVDIIKISDEEIPLLTDCDNEVDASKRLMEYGMGCVIVTMGSDGALVRTKDGYIYSDSLKTNIIDTTGAGDSFMGGFLYKLGAKKPSELTTSESREYARFANAAASICVSRRGAINAMPDIIEVNNILTKD